MEGIVELRKRYRVERCPQPFRALPEMSDAGLTLGRGTLLMPLGGQDGESGERLTVLLAAVYGRPVAPTVTTYVARAAGHWRRGDGAFAHIELAFARLPQLESEDDAFRLFLAETLLTEVMTPRALARALGFEAMLIKFAANQPRVPAGHGRESGQWTSDYSTGGDAAIVFIADKTTPDGFGYSTGKLENQMKSRNFKPEQVDEAVKFGTRIDAINKKTGGPATRYVNPNTGQSVVIDNTTKKIVQIGGADFEFGPGSGDVPGAEMRPPPTIPEESIVLPEVIPE